MPRLFTGIEIPTEIGQHLALLRGGLPGARWIDPENYHLTLRFIGDVDMTVADDVVDTLARVARTGFSISLDGLSSFGTKKPHAIVARLTTSQPLYELQSEIERRFQRLGLPPDRRKFTPHVTLARLRHVNHRDVATYLSARGGFLSQPIPVTRFVLFSSRNSVGGGPYVTEEAYPLVPEAHNANGDFDDYAVNF